MQNPLLDSQDEKTEDPERSNGPGGEGFRGSGSGGPGEEAARGAESGDTGRQPGQSGVGGGDSTGGRDALRYMGLAGQVAVSVGIALFLGVRSDKWLHMSFPIFSCALPLLVIVLIMVKLVKESSRKKDGK